MGLANSRQTLMANIAQQASAAATILILPNVLATSAFAETVYVGMLLSFMALADLGLTYVHNRVVPALSSRQEHEEIAHWDRTVHSFGLLAALVFAVGISLAYFLKFQSWLHALLLFPIAPLSFLASFHVSRISCLGNFRSYRRMTILRAFLAIGVLPLVYLWGITGWFGGMLLAAVILLVYVRKESWADFIDIDWQLVRTHVGEGLLRCGISVMWIQLLNMARLYASTHYSNAEIAEYGIVSSAYQSLAALIIAAFLPVTVQTLRHFGQGTEDAMQYAHRVTRRVAPWALLGTILVVELSPSIFRLIFPAYTIDPLILACLLSSVIFYPFFIFWGNCMVGAQRFFAFIGTISLGFLAAWLVADHFGSDKQGAAIGQFVGLAVFSFSLYLIAPKILGVSAKLWERTMLVFIATIGLGGIYGLLRWIYW